MDTIKEYSFPAAHLITEKGEDGKKSVIKGQTIKEHCEKVSNIAKGFAKSFGAEDVAALCGLAHDIGKYSKEFQRRIWEDGPKVDHSTAGAIELKTLKSLGFPCVAGHHSGLPDIYQLLNERLGGVLTKDVYRKGGKFCVSVSDRFFDSLRPALEIVNEEFAILSLMEYYNDETGIFENFEGGDSFFI